MGQDPFIDQALLDLEAPDLGIAVRQHPQHPTDINGKGQTLLCVQARGDLHIRGVVILHEVFPGITMLEIADRQFTRDIEPHQAQGLGRSHGGKARDRTQLKNEVLEITLRNRTIINGIDDNILGPGQGPMQQDPT